MKKTFNSSSVRSINDFWTWTKETLAHGLRADIWYDKKSQPYGLAGYLNDRTSRMIGYATLRQIRVKQSKRF